MWHLEQRGLSDSRTFQSQGSLTKKKKKKKRNFWPLNPYYKRCNLKTWQSERYSEALTSKLWSKKTIHAAEAYKNGAKLNYVHPL